MASKEKALVRIGFIGCGGNARWHMGTLAKQTNAQIVATCDIDEKRAKSAAEAHGATPYTQHQRMLERDDLDAVYLSLPVFAHGQPELDVIDRGLPFLVEKPVARTLVLARKIQEAVEKKGLLTCVGYQLRYCGSTDLARERLAGTTISTAVGRYWSGSGRGDASRWMRRMDLSGGQLVEQATHTIDMLRFLVGEVGEVYAKHANRQLPQIDCPDTHCVLLEFTNGVLGMVHTTWAYDPRDWSHANVVDILYDQNLLNWTPTRLSVTSDGKQEELTRPGPSIDEVFVEAVQRGDGSQIRSPYPDAVRSLAVSLAAIESAQTGRALDPDSL